METKDSLFHISWGDGDESFVIAPDEETAGERIPESKGMVNSVIRLDGVYQAIFKAGREAERRSIKESWNFGPRHFIRSSTLFGE